MKLVLLILLLFVPLLVRADEPRYTESFTSPNGKYVFRSKPNIQGDKNWILIEKDTKKVLYEFDESFGYFTVLVSNDGKNLVAIDDYSIRKSEDDPEVLRFFVDGKEVKAYKLSEVLETPQRVKQTVSHFLWIKKPFPLTISDSKLAFTTYEQSNFVFNINTGEILKKEKGTSPKPN